MYPKKAILLPFMLMIAALALYRVVPMFAQGFMPMLSISIFAGAVIKDKKLAVLLPLLAMLVSDFIFHFMYANGLSITAGFYEGQFINYVLFAMLVIFGFGMKKVNVKNVLVFSISGSVFYFVLSNFVVWATHTGFSRPMTSSGLMLCYSDALAFYRDYGLIKNFSANFILGDVIWSFLIFSSYMLAVNKTFSTSKATQ